MVLVVELWILCIRSTSKLLSVRNLCRSSLPSATYYRHVKRSAREHRERVLVRISEREEPRLHWIDNFVKILPRHSMHMGKQLLQSMQWTAHGLKFLDADVDMSWRYSAADEEVIPALPHLEDLLSGAGVELVLDRKSVV